MGNINAFDSILECFRSEMMLKIISPPTNIYADGHIHRFHIPGDRQGTLNGWYVLHLDEVPSGAFGSWKVGISSTWSAKAKGDMNAKESAEYCRRIAEVQRQRDQVQLQQHQQAAKRSQNIWNTLKSADPHHPYLIKKRILPFTARQQGNHLVLPVIDCGGQIWSLQFIDPTGKKLLLAGGAKKGRFILVNELELNSSILICEGWATGATLARDYPRTSVIAAIDANNLEHAAMALRRQWPTTRMIICADDDRQTIGNPGLTKGRRASINAGAFFISPPWPQDAPDTLTDFNDLACWLEDRDEK